MVREGACMLIGCTKETLRRQVDKRMAAMTLAQLAESNEAIVAGIAALPEYRYARTVFVFVGFLVEMDSLALIDDAIRAGKQVVSPRPGGDYDMDVYEIRSRRDLTVGSRGLPEPRRYCRPVAPDGIDFAVIPAAACDRLCNRLGDDGPYRRYLSRGWLCPAVSPCRELLLFDRLPVEDADTPVDMVVTESRVYRRRCGGDAQMANTLE